MSLLGIEHEYTPVASERDFEGDDGESGGGEIGSGECRSRKSIYLTLTFATSSFSAGAALKRTFLEALILMVSPVAGLRPERAAR